MILLEEELRKVRTIVDLEMTVMRHTSDPLPDTWEQAGPLSTQMINFPRHSSDSNV